MRKGIVLGLLALGLIATGSILALFQPRQDLEAYSIIIAILLAVMAAVAFQKGKWRLAVYLGTGISCLLAISLAFLLIDHHSGTSGILFCLSAGGFIGLLAGIKLGRSL
jgi:hypothetical protein